MSLWLRESIGEIVGGCILVTLGVVWIAGGGEYGVLGEGGRLAPGTVPFACGVGLVVTGAIIALKAAVAGRRKTISDDLRSDAESRMQGNGRDQPTSTTSAHETATAIDTIANDVAARPHFLARIRALPTTSPLMVVYGLLVISVMLMPALGFAPAFAILIFAILRLVERQSIGTSATVGIVTAVAGYFLFEVLFNLPLPTPFFI